MVDALRLISIHVEEPEADSFQWVIMERASDGWTELSRAAGTLDAYKHAMAAGLIALQEMISDLDVGPRLALDGSNDEQKDLRGNADAVRPSAKETRASDAKPKNASYFGFGPIR